MNILLLGANGQLGRSFLADGQLACRGKLTAASRDGSAPEGFSGAAINLTDRNSLERLLDSVAPDVIINAAAYTAVDKAESDEAAAQGVNGIAPGLIGCWAVKHNSLVVHYSTDYVFSGDATVPYLPDAITGPQGAYGRSKLHGEMALRDSGARHLILRTAWVYSGFGHNFLKTMLRLGAEREELSVVADQSGTPTSARLIVDGTIAALDRYLAASKPEHLLGTYHLTASGETTWHGFAETIFDEAVAGGLLPRRPLVHPITTREFPTPARRPAYSVMDNRSFCETFGHPLPDWRVGLRAVVQALAKP
jgi:dTDP-4-dehydrorhamnose reductase